MRTRLALLLMGIALCLFAGWIPQYNAIFDGEDVPLFSGGFDRPRPCVVDLDSDGDLDIVWSHKIGTLMLWENTGTPTDPHFEMVDERWGMSQCSRI